MTFSGDFEQRLSLATRQHHVARDKVFLDYSGKKAWIDDPAPSNIRGAESFVALSGASNFTYAKAIFT